MISQGLLRKKKLMLKCYFVHIHPFTICEVCLKILFTKTAHTWHYKNANADKAFLDKSTDEKASILTKAILNIMSNFIPNEIVTIDDRDPPWINNKIKSLIKNKTECFQNCVKPINLES